LRASLKANSNHDESLTLTTRFSLKTSGDSGLPSGHLIVTPSLTVKFSETRVISYNLTECKAHSDTIITWSLGDDGTNLNSFTLKAYGDIVGSEVASCFTECWVKTDLKLPHRFPPCRPTSLQLRQS